MASRGRTPLSAVVREGPGPGPVPGAGLAGNPEGGQAGLAADAASFAIATYAGQAMLFVGGVAQKGFLGPTLAGYWALMQTFWVFFAIAQLGVAQGAERQIPVHRGRGDLVTAGSVSGTGGSFAVLAMAVAGVLVATASLVLGSGLAPELRYGLVLTGLLAPLRLFVDVHQTILQATKRFKAASLAVVVRGAAALLVQTAAVYLLGFWGLFVGLLAIQLSLLVLWRRMGLIARGRPVFAWGIDRERLRELVSFGVPLLVYGQVWQLFIAIDSLLVASALDVRNLGFYALAVSVTSYVAFLPTAVAAAVFPRMAEQFGQTGDAASIEAYATRVQRFMAYVLLPVAVGTLFFFVPVLIRQALPAFTPAIGVVQVIVAASFCLGLMSMPVKLLLTIGYRWTLTAVVGSCVALNAGLNTLALFPLDLGLRGAAGATAISYLAAFVITTAYGLSRALPAAAVARHLGELLAVLAHTLGALWLVEVVLGTPRGIGPALDFALAVGKVAAFLALMSPWLVRAERRLGALTQLRSLAGRALRAARGR